MHSKAGLRHLESMDKNNALVQCMFSFAGLVARPAILSFTAEATFAEDNAPSS